MVDINLWAITLAALGAAVVGGVWYGLLFRHPYLKLRVAYPGAKARPTPVALLGDFIRYFIMSAALAFLFVRLGVIDWQSALGYGAVVWFGFQAMVLFSFAIHEKMPLKVYLVHSSDALVSTLVISYILSAWR